MHQRVAVGRRAGDIGGADHAVGARPVDDDDWFAEYRTESPSASMRPHDVGARAPAWYGNDDLDRALRIILRRRTGRSSGGERPAMPAAVIAPLRIVPLPLIAV